MFSPAATATAASAQLPPLRRISRPQALARGCVDETMPLAEWTVERREGKYEYCCSLAEGKSEVEWRGIVMVVVLRVADPMVLFQLYRNMIETQIEQQEQWLGVYRYWYYRYDLSVDTGYREQGSMVWYDRGWLGQARMRRAGIAGTMALPGTVVGTWDLYLLRWARADCYVQT